MNVDELLLALGPVRAVTRFAEGSVTGAYRVDFADPIVAPVVMKVYEADSAREAVKEAWALRFLTGHGIDISPSLLAFSTSAAPVVVSSLRPGRTLTEVDEQLTPAQHHDVYRQLGEVLQRLHAIPADAYDYLDRPVPDPQPDNLTHMTRMVERYLRRFRHNGGDPTLADTLTDYVATHATAFADCARPVYCHGDVHEPNLLVEPAGDGTWTLTGLLDPLNMHAGDPLMEFVRLDAFSMYGDPTKIAGLLTGYGIPATDGQWPESWRPRIQLYRIVLALELHDWFTISGQVSRLPGINRELHQLVVESIPRD